MKQGYTKKLYWGKWTHKITFHVGKVDTGKPQVSAQTARTLAALKTKLKGLIKECKLLESTIYVTSYPKAGANHSVFYYNNFDWISDQHVSFYFRDAALLDILEGDADLKAAAVYLEKPYSDSHVTSLEQEKMVVRKNLWFDRYRYCARGVPITRIWTPATGWGDKPANQDVRDWLREQLVDNLGRVEGVDFQVNNTGYYQTSYTYYFREAQDAMMFRLAWGDSIKSNERIRLLSELDE